MKKLSLQLVFVFAALVFIGTTEAPAQQKVKKDVHLNSENAKWEAMPGGNSVMSAMLWGDNTKGAYGGLTKFPAGFKAPLHYHTNDMKIVVIKGGYTYNGEKYGPGSYLFIPGGMKHESGGVADSETIFFTEQSGKFDSKPVDPSNKKK